MVTKLDVARSAWPSIPAGVEATLDTITASTKMAVGGVATICNDEVIAFKLASEAPASQALAS